MYNNSIKVANKIITENDLMEIFSKMWEEMEHFQKIAKQEVLLNERLEREYQSWTVKNFEGTLKFNVNFYDDTNILFDDYPKFIGIFNTRLHEIKEIYVSYRYSYVIKQSGLHEEFYSQSINMNIYEEKMDIDVNLNSKDKKMDEIYKLIENKILSAPEKYNRVIKKKSSITTKVTFALGAIPSIIIFTSLCLVPSIRELYVLTFIGYPFMVILFSFFLGGALFGGKLDKLYKNLVPEKKYAGYDTKNNKSIYKDDIDKYVNTSEIIIGKNVDNPKNREEIEKLENKYRKYIPIELLIIFGLTIIIILIGNIL